jgi:hypothetical protein
LRFSLQIACLVDPELYDYFYKHIAKAMSHFFRDLEMKGLMNQQPYKSNETKKILE